MRDAWGRPDWIGVQRLRKGKHRARRLARDEVEHHGRAPLPPGGQIPRLWHLRNAAVAEGPQGSESVFFDLIRESLECTRAPACVGFCLNLMHPDGGRASMGLHGPCPRRRDLARAGGVNYLHTPATALRICASRCRHTAGLRRLRRARPTSPSRGELA